MGVGTYGVGPQQTLTVQDIDGSPLVTGVIKMKFTNGSVTNDGGGVVTINTSAGDITGSGTANTIAKFTGTSSVGNSLITDDATTFAINTNKFTITEASGNTFFAGVLSGGSGPTTITDSAGKILSAALNTVAIAQGGTGTGSTLTGLVRGNASAMTAAEISGDATTSGSNALTLASVISAGGPTGSATVAPIITYDAKGRLTTVSSATIAPAVGSITGLGTGIATALAVNVGTAGAPVVNGGALGSPSSAGTIPAFTLGGTIAGGGNQLNNIIIGTSTPLAGTFTAIVGTSSAINGTETVTSTSATALTVGRLGATTPALQVDASTATSITGIKIKSAASAGGVAVSAIGETNVNLTVDANGSGTITLGGTSTGVITLTRATTLSAALTYGGVALSNAVTGTGNMVLSAGPTFTGTVTIPTPFTIGAVSMTATGTQLNYLNAATGTTGTTSTNVVFSTSPVLTTPTLGVATGTRLGLGVAADATATLITAGPVNLSASSTLTTDLTSLQVGGNGVVLATAARQASASMNVTQNAVGNAGAWKYISTDAASLYQQANGTHAFYVTASGTAGNTITWTSALSIANAGAITFSSGITNAAGTPGSLCYNTSTFEMLKNNALTCTVSASEYKEAIAPLTDGLDVALLMNPSQFAYKDNPNRLRWGFVADELQQVDVRLGDGYDVVGHAKSIDHAAIMAITVKAVQELNDKVAILEQRILTMAEGNGEIH